MPLLTGLTNIHMYKLQSDSLLTTTICPVITLTVSIFILMYIYIYIYILLPAYMQQVSASMIVINIASYLLHLLPYAVHRQSGELDCLVSVVAWVILDTRKCCYRENCSNYHKKVVNWSSTEDVYVINVLPFTLMLRSWTYGKQIQG